MLPTFIAIGTIIAVTLLWIIFTQRKLVALEENTNNAMNQIGAQLSGQYDALLSLLDLSTVYGKKESEALIELVQGKRRLLNGRSLPKEVLAQEETVLEVLGVIHIMARQYPQLKTDRNYLHAIDAVIAFEHMLRTSRMVYNNSVTKLNRAIRMFPVSFITGFLGFQTRAYL